MTTLVSFLEPMWLRWRDRNRCFYCLAPATRKCRTHATRICDSAHCKHTHRRLKSAVYGDLTRPFCEYFPLDTWRTHAVNSLIAIGVGLVFAWIVVAL